ncbi:Hypothetical protein NCS54_00339500 [Fusarium falciforme]|uniref:Hypothetical protein n=1 Tax=Fusarium falciforme TaxID=195108 RepID=UPI002300F685|nr:Hypothetical protein NCS54_00339500 [Fusarium falciforme]WAO86135.1 Hypothetical protein NCS54_00339500 [Fusarium falciforme]
MKFSTTSILFLAQGIAAMPWSSGKANEDITLHIQVSQPYSYHSKSSAPKGAIHPENFQVCLRVCWPSVPTCPDGWVSVTYPIFYLGSRECLSRTKLTNSQGTGDSPCWTCCKAPSDNFQL